MTQPVLWHFQRVGLSGHRTPRLQEVTLEIRAGATALVGPSGAGKTSLLNLLVDFERPDAGTLTANLPHDDDRLPLFWVPQNDGLWPHLTARQHLDIVMPRGARTHNDSRFVPHAHTPQADALASSATAKPSAWAETRTETHGVASLLGAFDLAHRAGARPESLSQGECARLSVARALASGAAVLVMDEPLAHVDPARVGRYWQVVRDHCAACRTSLIFATHAPEVALREATHAVGLDAGRVVFAGPIDELYHQPATPELAALLGAANWLSAEEAGEWLGQRPPVGGCYRPERLAVVPARESPLVVEAARFAGAVAEVDLRDQRTGRVRRFLHRPGGDTLRPGDRVWLRLCLLLMLLLGGVSGCGTDPAGPPLDVREVNYWPMPPDGPRLPAPRAMTVGPDHELYVIDNAGRVLVFDESGRLARQWHMPEYSVGNPEGICVFRDGRIAVADTHYFRVVFFDRAGKVLGMQGELGREAGQFIYPVAVCDDDAGNFYVAEYGGNDRIQKFSPDGKWLLELGGNGTGPGKFQRPSGIVWHDGKLYVADAFNNRLQEFADDGRFLRILEASAATGGLQYPYDLAQGGDGSLYVVEYGAGRVSRLDLDGNILGRYGRTSTGDGGFVTPWGLTVDDTGRLFVADTGNRRIVELRL